MSDLTPPMPADKKVVTVCAACLRACCWQGEFYCDDYKTASTTKRTVEDLVAMKLESPHYWVDADNAG